ncbi:MAG TPA: hypothetical protein VMS17_20485 [Gemmataceae bacterium]|nr:hypothetical protein [Gemmataceae bacterium]
MTYPVVGPLGSGPEWALLDDVLYGPSIFFHYEEPIGVDAATKAYLDETVQKVYDALNQSGSRFSMSTYVPKGKACVQATEARGEYIAGYLPPTWTVLSYTVDLPSTMLQNYFETKEGPHTYNVIRWDDPKTKLSHYWIADTYVRLYVKYIGNHPPDGAHLTPLSVSLRGRDMDAEPATSIFVGGWQWTWQLLTGSQGRDMLTLSPGGAASLLDLGYKGKWSNTGNRLTIAWNGRQPGQEDQMTLSRDAGGNSFLNGKNFQCAWIRGEKVM